LNIIDYVMDVVMWCK